MEPSDKRDARLYRYDQYRKMGFEAIAAEELARADRLGVPLWPGRVQNALLAGCSHGECVRIFV